MTFIGFILLLVFNYWRSRTGKLTISQTHRKVFFVHTRQGRVAFTTGFAVFSVWFWLHIVRPRGFRW